ncbi:hypothetical protein EDI_138560 [Entamoeba dispar SAW760]|uniref:Uncharacterized protein n=1 Tax=Entamoeba dispar (strain ATCC PRA-260 / SAW760) TaxID=370354 RepID=B0EIE9_ENTDS|nr:uncharacterized protein EDI_138560 [Entamoeba dispar SAW760]EDR25678.1 hypothetical protein EDI_138560 [Entamoeba dispar SAW760]|eukprot:EDR25678.1 hypothetical protein EDI_138560 [Entamoeba dispar SAW760]
MKSDNKIDKQVIFASLVHNYQELYETPFFNEIVDMPSINQLQEDLVQNIITKFLKYFKEQATHIILFEMISQVIDDFVYCLFSAKSIRNKKKEELYLSLEIEEKSLSIINELLETLDIHHQILIFTNKFIQPRANISSNISFVYCININVFDCIDSTCNSNFSFYWDLLKICQMKIKEKQLPFEDIEIRFFSDENLSLIDDIVSLLKKQSNPSPEEKLFILISEKLTFLKNLSTISTATCFTDVCSIVNNSLFQIEITHYIQGLPFVAQTAFSNLINTLKLMFRRYLKLENPLVAFINLTQNKNFSLFSSSIPKQYDRVLTPEFASHYYLADSFNHNSDIENDIKWISHIHSTEDITKNFWLVRRNSTLLIDILQLSEKGKIKSDEMTNRNEQKNEESEELDLMKSEENINPNISNSTNSKNSTTGINSIIDHQNLSKNNKNEKLKINGLPEQRDTIDKTTTCLETKDNEVLSNQINNQNTHALVSSKIKNVSSQEPQKLSLFQKECQKQISINSEFLPYVSIIQEEISFVSTPTFYLMDYSNTYNSYLLFISYYTKKGNLRQLFIGQIKSPDDNVDKKVFDYIHYYTKKPTIVSLSSTNYSYPKYINNTIFIPSKPVITIIDCQCEITFNSVKTLIKELSLKEETKSLISSVLIQFAKTSRSSFIDGIKILKDHLLPITKFFEEKYKSIICELYFELHPIFIKSCTLNKVKSLGELTDVLADIVECCDSSRSNTNLHSIKYEEILKETKEAKNLIKNIISKYYKPTTPTLLTRATFFEPKYKKMRLFSQEAINVILNNLKERCGKEVDDYLKEPLPSSKDSHCWWINHRSHYPKLYEESRQTESIIFGQIFEKNIDDIMFGNVDDENNTYSVIFNLLNSSFISEKRNEVKTVQNQPRKIPNDDKDNTLDEWTSQIDFSFLESQRKQSSTAKRQEMSQNDGLTQLMSSGSSEIDGPEEEKILEKNIQEARILNEKNRAAKSPVIVIDVDETKP